MVLGNSYVEANGSGSEVGYTPVWHNQRKRGLYLKEKSLQIKYLTENTPFQITLEQLQKIIT